MSKFARWAKKNTSTTSTPEPQPIAQPPAPTEPQVQVFAPVPGVQQPQVQPVIISTPIAQQPGILPTERWTPPPETCAIVKRAEHDPYVDLLRQVPDLVAQGVVPNHNPEGIDAMKLPGRPDMAVMNKWSQTTRYQYGVTDSQGNPSTDQHIQRKYQESLEGVRASGSAVRRR